MFPASRVITIGQSPDSAVRLEAADVAPRHAVLYVDGGRAIIADSGSNGRVLVNGRSIASAPITGLDDVRIGEFRLKVELVGGSPSFRPAGAEAAAPQPPAPAPPDGLPPLDAFAPARVKTYPSLKGEGSARSRAPETELLPGRRRARPSDPPPPPPDSRGFPAVPPTVEIPPFSRPDSNDLVGDLGAGLGRSGLGRPAGAQLHEPATVRIEASALIPQAPIPELIDETTGLEDTTPRGARRPAGFRDDVLPAGEVEGFLPPATAAPDEDDDEEEDDDRDFTPAFSLLDNVVRERFKVPVKAEFTPVVEVIRYREDRLLGLDRVTRGNGFRFFDVRIGRAFELLKHKRNGRARLFFAEGLRGNVVSAGQTTALADLCTEQNKADKKGKLFSVEIGEGDFAHIKLEGEGFLVRFVRPPLLPPIRYAMSFSREDKLYAGTAFLGIMLMLIGIWVQALISPPELFAMEEEVEFAEVSLKDLELEKPEEPKPPEPPPPEPEPAPPAEEPVAPEPAPKEPRRQRPRREESPGPKRSSAEAAAENALAQLENMVPSNNSLSTKVSNIAAVKVPHGSAKPFQVSGPIGKLPGGEVVLATGASGRETRSATKLLEGKSVAALGGGGGSGKVRGTVSRIPARQIGTTGGFLSREEILKVVNAGISDIQRCYERELMKSPDLAGKVVFDWVINMGGAVESARVRSSSLRSEGATACIGNVIKSWRFPKPTGGSVKVTFPFTFRSQSF